MAKDAMGRMIEEGVAKSAIKDSYIRLVVTRGVGDLGLDPRKCAKPTVFASSTRSSSGRRIATKRD